MTIRPTGVEPTEETTPPPTFRADLARFTSGGFGTLRDDPATRSLRPGDLIAVTDDDADTLRAEVLAVRDGEADIRVHWDEVLQRA